LAVQRGNRRRQAGTPQKELPSGEIHGPSRKEIYRKIEDRLEDLKRLLGNSSESRLVFHQGA
jgi:hypothetical protein